MDEITPPSRGSFARACLFVLLTGALIALTARPASAQVLVCSGVHQCMILGSSCEFWTAPSQYTCVPLEPKALKDPHLSRDGVAGASFVNGGETTPIISDVAESTLTKWVEDRRRGGGDRGGTDAFRTAFDAAFRSPDRRVSDQRLQRISRELGLPIEGPPGQANIRQRGGARATTGQRATLLAQSSTLTVTKTILPANATGTFRLMIDGFTAGTGGNVGDGGTTGAVSVEAITHVVSEAASPGTNAADYTAVFGGDCDPAGHVTVAAGDAKTCTITNTLKVSHGTWTLDADTATVSVCRYGYPHECTIYGETGASLTITMAAWGGGGGGGSGGAPGDDSSQNSGGQGGGGGGGGGYGQTAITVVVPAGGNALGYFVKVGGGGRGGAPSGAAGDRDGADGNPSLIRRYTASGLVTVLGATGGVHGNGSGRAGTAGAGGIGSIDSWGGLSGGAGAIVSGCNGGAGGAGGPGGGPGRTAPGYLNDGGTGGHGGYFRNEAWWLFGASLCTAESANNGQAPGMPGGHGRVTLSW